VKPRSLRSTLRPSSRPRGGHWSRAALFGLLALFALAPAASAAGPAPDSPPAPGAGTLRPELPRRAPASAPVRVRVVTTTVAAAPSSRPAPRPAAAAPATVRTVVVRHATSTTARRAHTGARPTGTPKPAPRRRTPPPATVRHRHVSPRLRPSPGQRPPYGLVALAALLATLGAGSLAATVTQLRAGAA